MNKKKKKKSIIGALVGLLSVAGVTVNQVQEVEVGNCVIVEHRTKKLDGGKVKITSTVYNHKDVFFTDYQSTVKAEKVEKEKEKHIKKLKKVIKEANKACEGI